MASLPRDFQYLQVEANGNGHAAVVGCGITLEEVAQHSSEDSAWFVHEGKVYDATPFLEEHPGGADSITIVAGQVRLGGACCLLGCYL